MKLLSVKQARSIWLVYIVELNPRGLNLISLIKPIVDKYNFQIYPSKPEEFGFGKENIGINFKGGNFQKDPQHNISFDLSVYNDGFVLDTRSSTSDSDTILDEFLNWLSTEYGMIPYQEVLGSKVYLSELYIQTMKSLNSLNPKLIEFSKYLASLTTGKHHSVSFETTGISFGTDPAIIKPPSSFKFERVIDVPFESNRYYSAAPLQTDAHLKILEKLEKILSI